MTAKKILIITRNLPPLIGGMERLNWHIADELSNENEVLILSHKEARNTAPEQCTFYGVPLTPLPVFLIFAFIKTFLICLTQKPDVIFAGSGLTAPIVTFWAKFFRKKSIIYIHGLDINNQSSIYRLIWVPFIQKADKVICNSTPTKQLCLKNNIKNERISIIHPGVNFPAPPKNEALLTQILKDYQLEHKKIILSVGRLTDRKGLLEFIDQCMPSIIEQVPEALLIIIGETANHALNNKFQSKESIINIAKKHGLENKILFTGTIFDEALSSFFYLADVHVFPVKHIPNDPEGFGMVAIEAASHGLPTVAFSTGGVVDAISNNQSGYLVANADYKTLSQRTIEVIQSDSEIWISSCISFSEHFSWLLFSRKLLSNL